MTLDLPTLPMGIAEASEHGYTITHKIPLLTFPQPRPGNIADGQNLAFLIEASITWQLWVMRPRSNGEPHSMASTARWPIDTIEYVGLCSHSAAGEVTRHSLRLEGEDWDIFFEAVGQVKLIRRRTHYANMSPEKRERSRLWHQASYQRRSSLVYSSESDLERVQRRAQQAEYQRASMAKHREGETPEQTLERYERQNAYNRAFKAAQTPEQRQRRLDLKNAGKSRLIAALSPEADQARRDKNAKQAAKSAANETAAERRRCLDMKKVNKRNLKAREIPEQRAKFIEKNRVHQKKYKDKIKAEKKAAADAKAAKQSIKNFLA